jgi:deazaflavin-dependent oxidoreductase (nitroreductase family)
MAKGTIRGGKPKGLLRILLRMPILLYRLRLGWMMGGRFLMIEHIGRKSGQRRRTVLEVVRHDREAGTWVVASGWGTRSDWFRNIRKTPEVVLHTGLRRRPARAIVLPEEIAAQELCDYARRHPAAFTELTRMMVGEKIEGDLQSCRKLAKALPVVAFKPQT